VPIQPMAHYHIDGDTEPEAEARAPKASLELAFGHGTYFFFSRKVAPQLSTEHANIGAAIRHRSKCNFVVPVLARSTKLSLFARLSDGRNARSWGGA
jgi:hypothetical protein